jgi:hypothetical protein
MAENDEDVLKMVQREHWESTSGSPGGERQ